MKRLLPSLLICLAALAASEWAAHAATYNFYFNNTEQGDNSTATPSVMVGDGKMEKKPGVEPSPKPTQVSPPSGVQTEPAIEDPAASRAKVLRGDPEIDAEREPAFPIGSNRTAHFRLSAGAGLVFERDSAVGPFFSLGFFANRYIGINFFGGSSPANDGYYEFSRGSLILGGELELTPLHLGTAAHPDIFELGLLAGASNLYPAEGNPVSPQIGARLSINFGNYVALTATVRGNAGYGMAEGGVAVRL